MSNEELVKAAQALLDEVDALIGESAGVYGLHLNGDGAPWDELVAGGRFERLSSLDALREALSAAGGEVAPHARDAIAWTPQTGYVFADKPADHFRDATKKPEPFGYFRPTIDGWEDCAETDEGAVALYDHPEQSLEMVVPDGFVLMPKKMPAAFKEALAPLYSAKEAEHMYSVFLRTAASIEAKP